MKKSILEGALTGLWVWLAYGIVEFALSVGISKFLLTQAELLPWQWPLVALLFGVYAIMGLLLGAAGGVWLARKDRIPSREDHRRLGCLLLSAAFAVNLIVAWPPARFEIIALVMTAALGATFCAAMRFPAWRRRTSFLASPVLFGLLLLVGPCVGTEALSNHSEAVSTAACLFAMGSVLGFAVFMQRVFQKKPAHPLRKAAVGTMAAILLWTATLAPGTSPLGKTADSAASPASGKPNILLITMDTVRADHVSAYGYERDTTPNLREFAREATRYERTIATDGFTLPTHASIFTGMYPGWHGATRQPDRSSGAPLPPDSRTLAGILRANGYWTAETAANYGYLGNWTGLTQGFDLSEIKMAMHLSDPDRPFYLRELARKILRMAVRTADFDGYTLRAPDINRNAYAMLEEARTRQKPFFLFLNYMDAHAPYLPPQPFRDRFSAGDPDMKPVSAEDFTAIRDAVNAGKRTLDEQEKRYLVSQYDAGIACIDFHIKKLLTRLRELGLYDNTLIIITADHGESFGDHGLMEHAFGSLYQDEVRVPLLVKYPGRHEAQRSDALVSQVDFLPTVLDVAGIAAPRGLQGRSLRSPRERDSGIVFADSSARRDLSGNSRLRGSRRAIFSGDRKLIVWTAGPPELYDLAADPNELHNLYQPADPSGTALMARIHTWVAAIPPRPNSAQSVKPMDKSTLDKLKSLGYVK